MSQRPRKPADALCTRCGVTPKAPSNHSWCYDCRNAYARAHRKPHSALSAEQRARSTARATANVAIKRGKLARLPCSVCGDPTAQKHHVDYSRPLDVRWFCQWCHDTLHIRERMTGCCCAVCGITEGRMLRQHRFSDRTVVLCANHAAVAAGPLIAWAAFQRRLELLQV